MVARLYNQYCGFSRALEVVGERWALLIVRDLLVGPRRFGELQRGLRGIPSNILSARLKELEEHGIVTRRLLPRPEAAVVYELTQEGCELEEPVIALARWGAKQLGDPRPDEIVTEDSIAVALLTTFRAEAAGRANVRFELHVGEVVAHALVRNGEVRIGRGSIAKPDLIIEAGPSLRELLAGDITPEEALKKRAIGITGDPKLLIRFTRMFRI